MDFKEVAKSRIILGDGAIGTLLQELGLPVGACPELWNVEHPDLVEKMHQLYAEAGAEVFTTNTFGGSAIKLTRFGLATRVEELNRRGAEIARKVAGPTRFVAGSMGPTGEFLEPLGTLKKEQLFEAYRLQAKGLADGGIDFFQIETMSDLEEASVALAAVRDVCELPALVSFTFNPVKTGFRTMMGVSVNDVVARFVAEGADLLGTNCGTGIEEAIALIKFFRAECDLPLFAAPNAGIPKLVENRTVFSQGPEAFAARTLELVQAGVHYLAGCCGTTPEHIRRMRRTLETLNLG